MRAGSHDRKTQLKLPITNQFPSLLLGLFRAPRVTAQRKLPQVVLFLYISVVDDDSKQLSNGKNGS